MNCKVMDESQRGSVFRAPLTVAERLYHRWLDRITPYTKTRWAAFALCFVWFVSRMVRLHKYYIYAYASGLYILFQFISFLTPITVDTTGEPLLPDVSGEEFRPFLRRLSEKNFWSAPRPLTRRFRSFAAVFLSLVFSFTPLDIPVFWPILLIYFVVLLILTMQSQIKHMIQHRYVPFDFGKRSYN